MISSNVYVLQIHNSFRLVWLFYELKNDKSTKNASVKSMHPNFESANLLSHLAMDRPIPI